MFGIECQEVEGGKDHTSVHICITCLADTSHRFHFPHAFSARGKSFFSCPSCKCTKVADRTEKPCPVTVLCGSIIFLRQAVVVPVL